MIRSAGARRAAAVAAVAIGMTVAAPAPVAACSCLGEGEGEVVFTGTVVDTPGVGDVRAGSARVYTFDVEDVVRGEALDGRVYTAHGPDPLPIFMSSCTEVFELGARYRVHADVVRPDADYFGAAPGVPLARNSCMAGEQLGPPDPNVVALSRSGSAESRVFALAGLVLVVGAAFVLGRGALAGTQSQANRRSVPN